LSKPRPKIFHIRKLLTLLFVALFIALTGSLLLCSASAAAPQTSANEVIIADFNVQVDPGSSAFMARVVSTAQNQHAAAIVVEMNTPGGLLSDMVDIINSITTANQSGIPTYTFIDRNGLGASAGSYIAMATNRIIMAPGSEIGPSTPIVVGGSALEQNHTQAAMLDLLTSLAQNWGRNTTAAFDMVQSDQAFSANEAVSVHIADGTADSLAAALTQLGLSSNQQSTLSENLYEQVVSTLSNTTLDGILFLIGIIAIV
jgi:membrane-bound serine protease (ClpP class)